MNLNMMVFIILAVAIVFLFIYIFISSKSIDRKFKRIGMALEDLNEEIFQVEKKQKKLSQELTINVEKLISEKMDEIVENLLKTIKDAQYKSEDEIKALYEKVEKLENNVKMSILPKFETATLGKKDEEKRIKELSEIGYSVEEIAKELNMPVGEVQFYLKIK